MSPKTKKEEYNEVDFVVIVENDDDLYDFVTIDEDDDWAYDSIIIDVSDEHASEDSFILGVESGTNNEDTPFVTIDDPIIISGFSEEDMLTDSDINEIDLPDNTSL